MAKKTETAIDAGRIEKVELGQLAVSPLNARKNAEVGPEDELVASIRAHGLLQPLVGYIAKSGLAMVLICAGQRRLLALRHVATPETKIPVSVVDEETAIEVSLAENLERKSMNPVDEFMAFKALIDTGHYDADRIASRFGFSLNLVKRRLKMAVLIPEVLEAVRDGAITVEAAEAYAAASDEVQRDVFKKHNAKNAWEPHKAERVRGDIALHGMSADSRVGKFIGGMKAYVAAGGTVLDEAFGDLFKDERNAERRMRDVSIVRELVDKRKEELTDKAEKLAKAKYPFATGFEWANLFGAYSVELPKPSKKSGLVVVGNSSNSDSKDIAKRVEQAATEHSAEVLAIISIDDAGKPEVWSGKFLVEKEAWDQVKPKEQSYSTYKEPTPEERAALQRKRAVCEAAARVAMADMSGVELAEAMRIKGRIWSYRDGSRASFDLRIEWSAEDLKSYWKDAEKALDEATAKADAEDSNFAETLAKLEKTPIVEWPLVTVVLIEGEDALIISRIDQAGPTLNLVDSDRDPWTSTDAIRTVEIIRDQIANLGTSIATYDTIEAYAASHAGTCQMCGCTEPYGCVDSEEDPDWHGPCSWAHDASTLCTNPDCLAKAGHAAKDAVAA